MYHFPSRFRILGSPFLGGCNSGLLILLPALGDICSERVIRVRSTEEGLDRQEDSSDLKSGRPVILEDIEANTTKLIDVWVENLGQESNLGRSHWIIVGEEELEAENTTLIRRLGGTVNLDIEISEVILVRNGTDSWNRLGHEPFCLFNNALGESHGGVRGVCEGISIQFETGGCGSYLGEYLFVRYRVVVAFAFERVTYRRVVVG